MFSFRMRLAAALLPCALILSGCGTDENGAGDAPPPTTAAIAESAELEPVHVTGEPGAKPEVTLPETPFTVSEPGHKVVADGDGEELTEDMSISSHFLLLNGKDGSELQSSFGDQVVGLTLGDDTLQPAIRTALVGRHVGARVLIAVPAREAVGDEGNAELGIAPEDTLLYYFEVTDAKTPLTEATGTPVEPPAGLPTVEMGATPAEPAVITVPDDATKPEELVVQPLIEGEGPEVQAGQTVRVSYTGVKWDNPGEPFDYSGQHPGGAAQFPVGQGGLIPAWDEGIPGHKVGSRLLIIAPPDAGYGDAGQPDAGIEGDDTLIFVVDILDAS